MLPRTGRLGAFLVPNTRKEVARRAAIREERGGSWLLTASGNGSEMDGGGWVQGPRHKYSEFSFPLFIDSTRPDEPHLPFPSPAHY